MTTPLDFDDIRRRHRESIAAAQTRLTELQKQRVNVPPVASAPVDPLENFGLNPPTVAGVITSGAPTNFIQPPPSAATIQAPTRAQPEREPLFGEGVLKGVMGAARALNTRAPFEGESKVLGLEPSLNPIRMATSALGLSGRIGQRTATQVIAGVQKALPGRQELETLVDDEIASGKGYIDALDAAFTRLGRSGGWSIPFATTALTPKGSITVNWEDLVAAGFDPIDIALTVGTGGGAKVVKGATKVALEAAKPFIDPGIVKQIRKATPAPPAPIASTVPEIPHSARLETQVFGGVKKGLGNINLPLLGSANSGLMGTLLKKSGIAEAINPTAIAANDAGKTAAIIYTAASAQGANMVEVIKHYVRGNAKNPIEIMFDLDKEGFVRTANIKLSKFGEDVYRSKGLATSGDRTIHFYDLAEFWLDPKRNPADFANSLFDGLSPEQIEALNRFRKVHEDLIKYAQKEGLIELKQGQTAGKAFEEKFGTPKDIYSWVHRHALGKQIVDNNGNPLDVLYSGISADGQPSLAFKATRTYETAIEGVAEGMKYGGPTDNLDVLATSIYRAVAEKRAAEVIERSTKLVTDMDVMKKVHPNLIAEKDIATKFLKIAEANVRRIENRRNRRVAKSPLLEDADDLADAEVIRNGAEYADHINLLQDRFLKAMVHLQKSKDAPTDGLKNKYRALYERQMGHYHAVKDEAERIFNNHQHLYRQTLASHRRIVSNDSEIFGLTNDLQQAEAQRALASLAHMRANKDYSEAMDRIAKSVELDARVFGHAKGKVPVKHFQEGPLQGRIIQTEMTRPLAGKPVAKSIADPLYERLKDRGVTVNVAGKERRPLEVISQFTGTARFLSAGAADIGFFGVHGAILAFAHPTMWAKAAKQSFKAMLLPENHSKYVFQNYDRIVWAVENGLDLSSVEMVQAIQRTGAFGRIGGAIENRVYQRLGQEGVDRLREINKYNPITQVPRRVGIGMNVFTDVAKLEMVKAFHPWTTTNALTGKEVIAHINNMMGGMNSGMLGVSPTVRQLEGSLLLFSPRYTRSAFALIAELARGSGKVGTLEGLATRDSMRSIAAFIGGGTAVMWAIGEATGKEAQLNPLKPGWLTVEVGGAQIGISGSMRALLDTMFRVVAIASGDNKNQDMNALVNFNPLDPKHRRDNPILQYALGRMAPGVRDILTRETFDGQPIENPIQMTGELAKKFMPFALQAQLFPPPGVPGQSPIMMVPETVGLRSRRLNASERLEAARDDIAAAAHAQDPATYQAPNWRGLDRDAQDFLEKQNQQLRVLEEASHAASKHGELGNYFERVNDDRLAKHQSLTLAAREFQETGNGRTFRNKYDEAMAVHRAMSDQTKREFSSVVTDLESRRKRNLMEASDFNRLLNEYENLIKDNPNMLDEFGNMDWDKHNAEEQKFRDRVGEDIFQRIRRDYLGFDINGGELPLVYQGEQFVRQLRRAREVLREAGYWKIADDIVGNDPTARAIWYQYENSDNPAEREAIKKRYRSISRIEEIVDRNRLRIRRSNPDVDIALMTFYGTRAVSRPGLAIERQIGRAARMQPVAAR